MIASVFERHANVALSFSGGKDSLAILHLTRPYWDQLTVYWMNPGNPFPETVELMKSIEALVPRFKVIHGFQREVIAQDGWPSDVVPHRHTTAGNLIFGATPFKVQSRLDCCYRALMLPTYQAMLADGVTCCIRGKRRDEADKTGLESGYVTEDGMELCFPINDWSESNVLSFLKANDIALPDSYGLARHSLDCMDCTAWWGEGISKFLRARHPEQHAEYVHRVTLIKQAISDQMNECEV